MGIAALTARDNLEDSIVNVKWTLLREMKQQEKDWERGEGRGEDGYMLYDGGW